ncbi:putative thioredoxin-like associated protein 1 [Plasmodium gaboni]|uniref:Putative thioredoxin-like associated protein 1 n=1 Tax=Plasmodium gaboni TaxID=647221 RepID=A0A151LGJ6_9APIC|nr:putative thioredoxin-like associated protein 1 [Plasmodium gaboni]KYN98100.1 putative thioredoxin-like associated protein 1 [Plasmodium gaboni]
MLQNNEYSKNDMFQHDKKEIRVGKKLVAENCGLYMDGNKNAGVVCNRITELNINSRKKTSNNKSDSSQMKNILNHINHNSLELIPSKRPLISYSTYDNQQKYFETKLVPDLQGKMSICVGRKSGSATVNINIDDYDLEKTYHTWKKITGKNYLHNKSNLENNIFLTVADDAERSDKLPIIQNRNPPLANPDGPFEKERLNLPKQARDNLDRTLTPLAICEKKNKTSKKKNIHIHNDSLLLLKPHENVITEHIKGVRRTNFPWIQSNRIKHILNYNYAHPQNVTEKHLNKSGTSQNCNYETYLKGVFADKSENEKRDINDRLYNNDYEEDQIVDDNQLKKYNNNYDDKKNNYDDKKNNYDDKKNNYDDNKNNYDDNKNNYDDNKSNYDDAYNEKDITLYNQNNYKNDENMFQQYNKKYNDPHKHIDYLSYENTLDNCNSLINQKTKNYKDTQNYLGNNNYNIQHNKGQYQVPNYNTHVETPQNIYNSHTRNCSNNYGQEINNVVHNQQEHVNGNNNYYKISSFENML